MLGGITKKIELGANVAIIVVASLLATVLVKNYLLKPTAPVSEGPNQTIPRANLTSLDVDWKQNGQTLLLAISTGCHFCTESAPFYKQITKEHQGTRLVAVLPQSVDEGTRYLDRLGVTVDEVRQVSLNSINVSGTPTLLLVDGAGVVTNSWIGKLPNNKEEEVLSKLSASVAAK